MMDHSILLISLGFLVGTFGTLIGAGGGFILMPVFFFLYPNRSAEELTAVSLAVVFLNSFSGSIAYAVKKRIDYRSGIIFALASIPGAVLGSLTTSYLSRDVFDPLFASLLFTGGIYLFLRPTRVIKEQSQTSSQPLTFNMPLGLGISVAVGYISSVLGIGGGIVHVPALVHLLKFPVHLATATSHFILAAMTFIATVVHYLNGTLASGMNEVLLLAPGVIIGAQAGAQLSTRMNGGWIIRGLALALVIVGIRLIFAR